MFFGRIVRATSVAAAALCAFQSGALAVPPAEVFGTLPTISDASISPDGKHLAVIGPVNDHDAVTVFTLDSPTAKPMQAAFPDADAIGLQWANNNRLICTFKANIKQAGLSHINVWVRAISVAMDGGPAVVLMHDAPLYKDRLGGTTNTASIADTDPSDPDSVYMIAYESGSQMGGGNVKNALTIAEEGGSTATGRWSYDEYFLNYFKVNVTTGDSELIVKGTPETIEYVTDGKGHVMGRIDQTSNLVDHFYVGASELAKFDVRHGDPIDMAGLKPDGSGFLAVSYGSGDKRALYNYQFGAPNVGDAVFSSADYDLADVFTDPWTNRVVGYSWVDDKVRYHYFDEKIEHAMERVERALPGQSVKVVSWDRAHRNYVIAAEAPKNPRTYYLFDSTAGQLSIVGSTYPSLTPADLGEERPYSYKSKDGTPIHAYLTLPPGKSGTNLPTVILPHGGPAARDEIGFDWLAQFLASRGYAVLQPNFRGSYGYGRAFRDAGNGQWAKGVLDDINGGTEQLIRDGIADPRRICIFGWSYGGYAALAAATFTPEHYACAASMAGVADLQVDLDHTKRDYGEYSQALSIWEERMGATVNDSAALDAESPDKHAENVRAPILLMHSDKDVTVYVEQSEAENAALQRAGKNVQFVKMDGDDHYLLHSTTRIQMLKTLEAFLASNIGT